jgi:type I restriction enzyme S subunit
MFGLGAAVSPHPVCSLAEVVRSDDQINYGVVQPGDDCEIGVPLVRVANLVANSFSVEALKRIDPIIEAKYKRSRLRGDEVLIACVGSVGAVALATPALLRANIARAVARIPVDPRKAHRIYVAEFLRLPRTQSYFQNEIRAVAQPTLNIKQLSETRIVIPPLEEQQAFADRVAEISRNRAIFKSHLDGLDNLFASLQHRAFTGQLTARQAERELEMAG